MLLKGIAAVSLILAAVICVCCGLALWLFPVLFLAFGLGLTLAAFLFLWFLCRIVDLDKPQEHDSKFYRTIMYLYIDAIMAVARVRVHKTGMEKTPKSGRFLLVCNHLNDSDPPILFSVFKKSQLAFISKKENHDMFIVGDIMHKTMCQLLNRENDREALKTILKCIQLIKDDEVSIGVFPEGGIRGDGKLHRLKGGVFKIARRRMCPSWFAPSGVRRLYSRILRN